MGRHRAAAVLRALELKLGDLRLQRELSDPDRSAPDDGQLSRLEELVNTLALARPWMQALQSGDLQPLALPLGDGDPSDRAAVSSADTGTASNITVFVSAQEPTPAALRAALYRTRGYHAVRNDLGRDRAVIAWNGMDPRRLAEDLAGLAESRRVLAEDPLAPAPPVIRVVAVDGAEAFVAEALADDVLAGEGFRIDPEPPAGWLSDPAPTEIPSAPVPDAAPTASVVPSLAAPIEALNRLRREYADEFRQLSLRLADRIDRENDLDLPAGLNPSLLLVEDSAERAQWNDRANEAAAALFSRPDLDDSEFSGDEEQWLDHLADSDDPEVAAAAKRHLFFVRAGQEIEAIETFTEKFFWVDRMEDVLHQGNILREQGLSPADDAAWLAERVDLLGRASRALLELQVAPRTGGDADLEREARIGRHRQQIENVVYVARNRVGRGKPVLLGSGPELFWIQSENAATVRRLELELARRAAGLGIDPTDPRQARTQLLEMRDRLDGSDRETTRRRNLVDTMLPLVDEFVFARDRLHRIEALATVRRRIAAQQAVLEREFELRRGEHLTWFPEDSDRLPVSTADLDALRALHAEAEPGGPGRTGFDPTRRHRGLGRLLQVAEARLASAEPADQLTLRAAELELKAEQLMLARNAVFARSWELALVGAGEIGLSKDADSVAAALTGLRERQQEARRRLLATLDAEARGELGITEENATADLVRALLRQQALPADAQGVADDYVSLDGSVAAAEAYHDAVVTVDRLDAELNTLLVAATATPITAATLDPPVADLAAYERPPPQRTISSVPTRRSVFRWCRRSFMRWWTRP